MHKAMVKDVFAKYEEEILPAMPCYGTYRRESGGTVRKGKKVLQGEVCSLTFVQAGYKANIPHADAQSDKRENE